GLHALGAARLADVAALRTASEGEASGVPLPARTGLVAEAGGRAPRRRLSRVLLDAAIRAARALLRELAALHPAARRPLAGRAEALRRIASDALGWRASEPGGEELSAALARGALGPPEVPIDQEELRLLLARRLADAGRVPLGGAGGGVQILNVTEARGRT